MPDDGRLPYLEARSKPRSPSVEALVVGLAVVSTISVGLTAGIVALGIELNSNYMAKQTSPELQTVCPAEMWGMSLQEEYSTLYSPFRAVVDRSNVYHTTLQDGTVCTYRP